MSTKKKTELQKNWENIRKEWQVQLNSLSKEAKVLGKRTEKFIHDVSIKGKAATEALVLKVKREQLYNQLGRSVTKSPKGSQKTENIKKEIAILNRQIKLKEKQTK